MSDLEREKPRNEDRLIGEGIRIDSDEVTMRVTASRSLSSGIGGALFCLAFGGMLLLTGTRFGNSFEIRVLVAAGSLAAAVACIGFSLQKERLVLDIGSNTLEHHWDGGMHSIRTRLTGVRGPTVVVDFKKPLAESHCLRFDDSGTKIDALSGRDPSDLESVAQEIVAFLKRSGR
jgi:hypothetical protein